MKIIAGEEFFQQLNISGGTAISIGKFDGVHIGHQKILEKLLEKQKEGLKTLVFTFDPPPAVLFARADYKELMSREEKYSLFEDLGIDYLVEYPLNEETAAISPEEFVRSILVEKLHMEYIAGGKDISFGARGRGDIALLWAMSEELHYRVDVVEKVWYQEQEVSSTYIRGLLEKGNMLQVETLCGRPFCVTGKVCHGNQIGRTLGFPTVNQLPSGEKLLPPFGVYFSRVRLGDKLYYGVSNVGKKPTIHGENQTGVETYIYDFDQDVYEEEITVYLYEYRRREQVFSGLEALQSMLQEDIREGRKYWKLQ